MDEDIVVQLLDLHKQATTEKSHYYVGGVTMRAAGEILRLRNLLKIAQDKHQQIQTTLQQLSSELKR